MVELLATLGIVLDADAILKPAIDDPSMSVGRPWIARALVEAGTCQTIERRLRVDGSASAGRRSFRGAGAHA